MGHKELDTSDCTFTFCFIGYAKGFDCVDHNKLQKILQEMGMPDLTYLLRNLYVGQEATVRTRQRTMNWFKAEKGMHQTCVLSPCLFKSYVEAATSSASASWQMLLLLQGILSPQLHFPTSDPKDIFTLITEPKGYLSPCSKYGVFWLNFLPKHILVHFVLTRGCTSLPLEPGPSPRPAVE